MCGKANRKSQKLSPLSKVVEKFSRVYPFISIMLDILVSLHFSMVCRSITEKLLKVMLYLNEKNLFSMVEVYMFFYHSFQYGRSLRNFHAEQPHQHAVYFTSVLMSELLWTQEELLDALEGMYSLQLCHKKT